MPDRHEIEVEGLSVRDTQIVRRAIERAQEALDCGLVGVEVCGIGPVESRSLNRRYRGRDKAASVLSFSLPTASPGGMAGQVLISPRTVEAESRRLGVSYRDWLAELSVHGFLHVLGHRHDDEGARNLMFAHQRALLRRRGRS